MAMSRTLLKSIALEGAAPDECLRRVNRLLCEDNSSETFVSLFYGILDTQTGELAYCNGGHDPPFVLRSQGSVEMLPGTGCAVLAALPEAVYAPGVISLRSGDTLFLYTDGVTEAIGQEGDLFTSDRLRALLESQITHPARTMIQKVVQEVRRHSASVEQSDDITALALKYIGSA
jgi:sigma-B regulation protein RsbU (phosphoserine phosphatase)